MRGTTIILDQGQETEEAVDDVIWSVTSSADGDWRYGRKNVYNIAFPKSFTGTVDGRIATIDGNECMIIGSPRRQDAAICPTRWNLVVEAIELDDALAIVFLEHDGNTDRFGNPSGRFLEIVEAKPITVESVSEYDEAGPNIVAIPTISATLRKCDAPPDGATHVKYGGDIYRIEYVAETHCNVEVRARCDKWRSR